MVEALSREIRSICPEELLCVDELAMVCEKFKFLKALKGCILSKRLRINFKMAEMMISSKNDGKVTETGKFVCAVCRKSVGSNSIPCQFCRC